MAIDGVQDRDRTFLRLDVHGRSGLQTPLFVGIRSCGHFLGLYSERVGRCSRVVATGV